MATEVAQEEAPPPEDVAMANDQDEVFNPFDEIDFELLDQLQSYMEAQGYNTEKGVAKLVALGPSDPEFDSLVDLLIKELGMTPDTARQELIKWQGAHKELQEELEKQKQGSRTQQPIWRCAVCGAANMPYIACYVAPYVAYYQPIDVPTGSEL